MGVSQPQIHNLLKGKRRLQPTLADRLLATFEIDILDLLDDQEVRVRLVGGPMASRTVMLPAPEDRPAIRKGPTRISRPLPEDKAG